MFLHSLSWELSPSQQKNEIVWFKHFYARKQICLTLRLSIKLNLWADVDFQEHYLGVFYCKKPYWPLWKQNPLIFLLIEKRRSGTCKKVWSDDSLQRMNQFNPNFWLGHRTLRLLRSHHLGLSRKAPSPCIVWQTQMMVVKETTEPWGPRWIGCQPSSFLTDLITEKTGKENFN